MVKLPKIGMRMIKTVIAVFICFLLDYMRQVGTPFYSVIGAIVCIQPDVEHSLQVARSRIAGTFIGGVFGLFTLLLMDAAKLPIHTIFGYLIISLLLLPIMYITVLIKLTSATYISCVVFLCITISHGMDTNPIEFAGNRMIDTLLGVMVALCVNSISPIHKKKQVVGEVGDVDLSTEKR